MKGTMKKIVVNGSIAYDYLMSFPGHFSEVIIAERIEHISLSFLVDTMVKQRGGIAANIAYTLALLGGRPTIMGTAGQDFAEYRAWLEDQGIDTSAVAEIENVFTASYFATTDLDQNQIASFYPGAMAYAHTLTYKACAPDADLTIISPTDPDAMHAYVRECKQLGIPYIYDPSQQTIRLSGEQLYEGLDGCFLLAVNTYEFELIQRRTGLSAEEIGQLAGGVLVTSGSEGSDLTVGDDSWHIPAVPPEKIVEPTGAGDAFRAGLIRGIQLGLPWPVAGRLGALAATYVLENVGTQNHRFTREGFVARFRRHFDDEGALGTLLAPALVG
jgi:adenosine kinase